MKHILFLSCIFVIFVLGGCQKKTEKTVEDMGDTSSMKVMQVPGLNSIPQIPQTLPTTLPSSLPTSLPAKVESVPSTVLRTGPSTLPSSQPATW